jgi:hypothetical protein
MTSNTLVLGFAGVLALCVIGLGFAGQFRPANLHHYRCGRLQRPRCFHSQGDYYSPIVGRLMSKDDLVLSFARAMAVCVIFAGLSARLASADPHQFDVLMGLRPPAECSDHNVSEVKPHAPVSPLNLLDASEAS